MSLINFIQNHISNDSLKILSQSYSGKVATVTGGASFIGSHLTDCLIELGCKVQVIDDLSSGKVENLQESNSLKFERFDLRLKEGIESLLSGSDFVFHLAAIHGGRGFIETYKSELLANVAIDNNVFSAAIANQVSFIIHASSACAYPINLQESETTLNLLSEDMGSMTKPETSFPDGVYGWTKLFGEYQLENSVSGTSTKGRSARIFTAYGERENESHAAIALIAKALLKADPYPVWGTGQQTRNFTYVADTVAGLLFLGSDTRDLAFDVFNIGTPDHIRVADFINEIFLQIGWNPHEMNFQLDKPVGVSSRASNNKKIESIFHWAPNISIQHGLLRTIQWYENSGLLPVSLAALEERLSAR